VRSEHFLRNGTDLLTTRMKNGKDERGEGEAMERGVDKERVRARAAREASRGRRWPIPSLQSRKPGPAEQHSQSREICLESTIIPNN